MNYIGGKYKLLPQILKFFPKRIDRFVDLFAGGLDVSLNVNANSIYCNDINNYVIDMYRTFQQHSTEDVLNEIDRIIDLYGLSKTNQEGYLNLRSEYNKNRNPFFLFSLISFGFNHQIRFNNDKLFNNPFGKNRSCFNSNMRTNLILFQEKIPNFIFSSNNFRSFNYTFLDSGDFVYADPPYLITCGSYNDGKRGFEGWSSDDDEFLFHILDELNGKKIRFALSNVTEHKGNKNVTLERWATDNHYHIHRMNFNYDNSNYQSTGKNNITKEVLITNY